MKKKILFRFLFLLLVDTKSHGSSKCGGFRINGSAIQLNQQCYQLTTEEFDQAGSMWNENQIDLR